MEDYHKINPNPQLSLDQDLIELQELGIDEDLLEF